jgi:hypothetical protein
MRGLITIVLTRAFGSLVTILTATGAHASCTPCAAPPGMECQCLTTTANSCKPPPKILAEFNSHGGCSAFGAPVSPARPRLSTGGRYQEFDRGEIAEYSSWTSGANTPDFLLSAYRKDSKIVVDWGSTAPFEYDYFILRWDIEDHEEGLQKQHKDGKQQIELDTAATGGHAEIDAAGEGTYRIYVEGCKSGGILADSCDQGWSHPVYVDNLPVLPAPVPQPAQAPLIVNNQFLDVPDPVVLEPAQQKTILKALCRNSLLSSEEGHEDELETTTALADLDLAKRGLSCDTKSAPELRDEVNAAILAATVKSVPGTDVSYLAQRIVQFVRDGLIGAAAALLLLGPVFMAMFGGPASFVALVTSAVGALLGGIFGQLFLAHPVSGDYDMRLTGLIQIIYRFEDQLSAQARDKLIHKLLIAKGDAGERRDFVWISGIPTPIRETENHVLMTESARQLTNGLLAKETWPNVPEEYNNDLNGMNDWVLETFRELLITDFYELNSRPYAYYAVAPVQNLYEFAAPYGGAPCSYSPGGGQSAPAYRFCDVRRAARSVLDFHAAKFASSSNELRRASPFRRQPPFRNYTKLLTMAGDDMTWRYAAFTGGSEFLALQRHFRYSNDARETLMMGFQGYYRPSVLITDLIRSPATTTYKPLQLFRSSRRGSETVELYYRHPSFLISAGGVFDSGVGVAAVDPSHGEDAWALPTTLMPTREGTDYLDFVRIEGNRDERERINTCVAPGFACGMNPALPPGIPDACKVSDGNWTFVNFNAKTADCPFDYGYFVAFYKEECAHDLCRFKANGNTIPNGDQSFGFFEAAEFLHSFEAYQHDILTLNQGRHFDSHTENQFDSPTGLRVKFVPAVDKEEWGIHEYQMGGAPITTERFISKWRVADGNIMRAPPPDACIVIENQFFQQKLTLDLTNAQKPRRTIVPLSRRCECPLPDYCLPFRTE